MYVTQSNYISGAWHKGAFERVLEKKVKEQMKIDDMMFGFTHGKSATDAIFIVRQIQEMFRAKDKRLNYVFVDLKKAFERVPKKWLGRL